MQSVPITTKVFFFFFVVVSLNLAHGEVYLIQYYVIYLSVTCIAAGLWFSPGTPVSSTNKIDCHYITEILLKVALNTINYKSSIKLENEVKYLKKRSE